MSYKRHWDGKRGLSAIYEKQTAACQQLEVSMLHLEKGEQQHFPADAAREYACVILGGSCDVNGDAVCFKNIGRRKNVFDGKAYAFYIPIKTEFTVTCLSDTLDIAIAMCPCTERFAPQLITPEDVIVKFLGKPGFEREAHFLIDERIQAGRVYVGENFIEGGQWSSYPGHKHDVDRMPTEGFAEEIYYYEFDKPTGMGIQKVYTGDKTIDETYTTYHRDFVEIPQGYHPCAAAPGYREYLLWMMSCDHRGFYMSIDPDHAFLNQ